jgi:hypothetical protein
MPSLPLSIRGTINGLNGVKRVLLSTFYAEFIERRESARCLARCGLQSILLSTRDRFQN